MTAGLITLGLRLSLCIILVANVAKANNSSWSDDEQTLELRSADEPVMEDTNLPAGEGGEDGKPDALPDQSESECIKPGDDCQIDGPQCCEGATCSDGKCSVVKRSVVSFSKKDASDELARHRRQSPGRLRARYSDLGKSSKYMEDDFFQGRTHRRNGKAAAAAVQRGRTTRRRNKGRSARRRDRARTRRRRNKDRHRRRGRRPRRRDYLRRSSLIGDDEMMAGRSNDLVDLEFVADPNGVKATMEPALGHLLYGR